MQFSSPTAGWGYYRGAPGFMGDGAGSGNISASAGFGMGVGPSGGNVMAGGNVFTAGQGTTGNSTGWSPTILYLFALIVVEMFVFALIARHL